jgi:hypothetical protein
MYQYQYYTFGTTRYILLRCIRIRIRSVLRCRIWIWIRSKSVRIRNTVKEFSPIGRFAAWSIYLVIPSTFQQEQEVLWRMLDDECVPGVQTINILIWREMHLMESYFNKCIIALTLSYTDTALQRHIIQLT